MWTIEKRQEKVTEFVRQIFEEYPAIKFTVKINDSSEPDYTDFIISLKNTTNKKEIAEIIRCHDYEGGFEVLKGEDMFSTDEQDFLMTCFISTFLTHHGWK